MVVVVAIEEIKFVPVVVVQPMEVVVNWGSNRTIITTTAVAHTKLAAVVKVEETVVVALTEVQVMVICIVCESTCNVSSKAAHRCPLSGGKCQCCQFMRDMHEVGCLA